MTENEKINETTQQNEQTNIAEKPAEENISASKPAGTDTAEKKNSPSRNTAVPEGTDTKAKKPMSAKKRHRLISIVTCLLIIAAVILVNVIAATLTSRLSGMTADITSKHSFEISSRTREIAEKTGKQVTITILSDRISYINYDPYCRQTAMLVEEMERVSGGMIKVEYTDIVRNPSFTDKYPDEELSKTDIIVSCADKYVHLTPAELFTFENYSGNYQYIASSHAEEEINNAIVTVTNEQVTNVALITDYTNEDYTYFAKSLTSKGYTVRELSLLSSDIPEDTDMAVIFAPSQDYSSENTDKIRSFISNNGKYGKNLLFISETNDNNIPNLDKLLEEYGLGVGHGYAFEADGSKINASSTNFFDGVLCNYASDEYTELVKESGKPVITGYSRPVMVIEPDHCTALLTYSEYSGICPFDAGEDWDYSDAISGKTIVLAKGVTGTENAFSTIIVSGSCRPFSRSYYGSDYANSLYLSTMIASVNGRDTSRITVAEKVITEFDLKLDKQTAMTLGFIVYAFIPILILGAGFVVFLRRINR